ncbi:MAG: GTP-binding protein [Bacteroidales bacterium]|nr:GTP-binding protein [Bacteroidales bacterium]
MKPETPVLLLTGYLGSGKTTLVNRILSNRRGIKFAVIVNDIGEVNIDADLIQKGGIVGQNDDSLVALQNGCICCTLKMDLVKQIAEIIDQQRFDYIVIEASGICEPDPIAQTISSIPSMGGPYTQNGVPRLDCIVTVVDALRMQDEFACGDRLLRSNIAEDDIENLVIQQIEFCNIVLLNKASEVSRSELNRLREIVLALQPAAKIIECDYGDVDLDLILNTNMFDFEKVATSATWIREIEGHQEEEHDAHDDAHDDDDDNDHDHHHDEHEHDHHHDEHDEHDHDEHGHHHHHHHDHEGGEVEEYGIGTYVYYRRRPFSLGRFDEFVARKLPKNVIRAKGICYFKGEFDKCYLFEQAGRQLSLKDVGLWFATMSPDELAEEMIREPGLRKDWDEQYGDRMQKIVFIGQRLDKEALARDLDACLTD